MPQAVAFPGFAPWPGDTHAVGASLTLLGRSVWVSVVPGVLGLPPVSSDPVPAQLLGVQSVRGRHAGTTQGALSVMSLSGVTSASGGPTFSENSSCSVGSVENGTR